GTKFGLTSSLFRQTGLSPSSPTIQESAINQHDGRLTMDFNPRTATGIPTEPVGSIPRPLKLQQAYAAYDAKKITKAQLEEEQNAAVADTIKRFEATGSPIITDGEQRVSSFATYPIADTLAGTGLAPHLAPGGQYFAIFADGHNRQLPQDHRRPVSLQFLCGRVGQEGGQDDRQAAPSGGDRAVDDVSPLPTRRRSGGISAQAV